MEGIFLFLEGLGKFFNLFGEASSVISTNWFFGEYLTEFFEWLISFFAGIFG